jgi:hypothetical protein
MKTLNIAFSVCRYILLVVLCVLFVHQVAFASIPTDENGTGNQNNWMLALLHNGDIYYSNHYDSYNIYKESTTGGADIFVAKTSTQWSNPECNIMGSYEDWLYYCDGNVFYRLDTNSGEREALVNGQKVYAKSGIQVVKVVSDMVYFLSNSRNGNGEYVDNLWGMNMNGAFLHNVQGVKAGSFVSDGQYIYYTDVDRKAIMRFNPADDTKISLLINSVANKLNLGGDMLYFIRDGELMKMSIYGIGLSQIGDVRSGDMNVIGDWIYYSNAEDNYKLYRITTDGLHNEKLCDVEDVCHINIAGEWVYFLEFENRDGWATFPNAYKIRLDGSDLILAQP